MKRDMDLVRKILLKAIAEQHGYTNGNPSIEGVSDEQVGYHVWLMEQAGLVHAIIPGGLTSESPYAILVSPTWNGHDFADAAVDNKIWKKAMRTVLKEGKSFTFSYLKHWLESQIPPM
ncbi:DUF2513 domain-containing protein [Nitrosomonas sp. HPC101]|uniref:DUF2513 domain-containing protein n=1 Tax=Nitrosomonas sp. HPC101 TaxID=1658667 RepID=UPI0013703878|nr:DUF2513 domain-containing protein [Nitrosomonas sp. HPC101]MXS85317.1 DUF2513 domain-containing protein [Nitrosomonas sp. HPC101]